MTVATLSIGRPERRFGRIAGLLGALVLLAGAGLGWAESGDDRTGPAPWEGDREALERCLESGEIFHREDIPVGVSKPQKLHLDCDGRAVKAIWKPLRPGYDHGWWESYVSEIVAYRLDRLLDLGLVPPTVERTIGYTTGSVQFWVDGFEMYGDDEERLRKIVSDRTWCRVKMFDYLINNPDRNAGNILVRGDGRVVLVDHSRAGIFKGGVLVPKTWHPVRYDEELAARLVEMDESTLREGLEGLARAGEIRKVLRRRDRLTTRLKRDLQERGPEVVF